MSQTRRGCGRGTGIGGQLVSAVAMLAVTLVTGGDVALVARAARATGVRRRRGGGLDGPKGRGRPGGLWLVQGQEKGGRPMGKEREEKKIKELY